MKCFFNIKSTTKLKDQSCWYNVTTLILLFLSAVIISVTLQNMAFSKEITPGLMFSENRYQHHRYVEVTLSLDELELSHHWENPESHEKYGSMNSFNMAIRKNHKRLLFAINSGIYTKEYTPLGLYIEKGKSYMPLNLVKSNEGQGNFALLPNGVFYITDKNRAYVSDTDSFYEKYQGDYSSIRDAVQSGPMLIVDGKYNTHFLPKSESLRIRSGVCASDSGRKVTFVVTEDRVNFYEFASYFKDKLQCKNALYLDGTLARMYVNGRIYGASFWQAKPLVGIWAVIKND